MTTDWLSGTAILLAGLVVGFMFVYAAMRRKQEAHDDLDRGDRKAKRDALIAQRRAGDVADDERARIEREAAEVLRALDGTPPRSPVGAPALAGSRSPAEAGPPSPAEAGAPLRRKDRPSSALAGFFWGAGTDRKSVV